jgi:hypothetical protein
VLLSASTYLTYENGTLADVATGVYNHHVAVSASGIVTKMPFSCSFEPAKTTVTAGNNTALARGHGVSDKKNQPFFDPSAILSQYPELAKYLLSQMENRSLTVNGGLLFGSGDDGAPTDYFSQDASLKAGLYINKDVTVSHYTEVINYRNFSQVVYIAAEIEYVPGKPAGYREASMGAMSATGCGGVGFCTSGTPLPPLLD